MAWSDNVSPFFTPDMIKYLINMNPAKKEIHMASQSVTINVEGMSCGHCTGMVQKTLEGIKGITKVTVNLDGKTASFDVDTPDLIDQAVKLVTEAGYKASE